MKIYQLEKKLKQSGYQQILHRSQKYEVRSQKLYL